MASNSLATSVDTAAAFAALSIPRKFLLLLANAIPFGHTVSLGLLIYYFYHTPGWCVALGLADLYLLPPILARIVSLLFPIRRQMIPIGSRDFFSWWITLNFQVLYGRFPTLEEVLRLVPGLYSLWLRLWGSRIGRATYWAAGFQVFDRQYLKIGHFVTMGANVRITPHMITANASGQMVLLLAPIEIADRVSIGGSSLLVSGTYIASDQATRAFLIMPPFSRLIDGRRVKLSTGISTTLDDAVNL